MSIKISTKPDIFRYKITRKDQFMIMACDGLWDVINENDLMSLMIYNSDENISTRDLTKSLLELAKNKGTADNTSLIVIKL